MGLAGVAEKVLERALSRIHQEVRRIGWNLVVRILRIEAVDGCLWCSAYRTPRQALRSGIQALTKRETSVAS